MSEKKDFGLGLVAYSFKGGLLKGASEGDRQGVIGERLYFDQYPFCVGIEEGGEYCFLDEKGDKYVCGSDQVELVRSKDIYRLTKRSRGRIKDSACHMHGECFSLRLELNNGDLSGDDPLVMVNASTEAIMYSYADDLEYCPGEGSDDVRVGLDAYEVEFPCALISTFHNPRKNRAAVVGERLYTATYFDPRYNGWVVYDDNQQRYICPPRALVRVGNYGVDVGCGPDEVSGESLAKGSHARKIDFGVPGDYVITEDLVLYLGGFDSSGKTYVKEFFKGDRVWMWDELLGEEDHVMIVAGDKVTYVVGSCYLAPLSSDSRSWVTRSLGKFIDDAWSGSVSVSVSVSFRKPKNMLDPHPGVPFHRSSKHSGIFDFVHLKRYNSVGTIVNGDDGEFISVDWSKFNDIKVHIKKEKVMEASRLNEIKGQLAFRLNSETELFDFNGGSHRFYAGSKFYWWSAMDLPREVMVLSESGVLYRCPRRLLTSEGSFKEEEGDSTDSKAIGARFYRLSEECELKWEETSEWNRLGVVGEYFELVLEEEDENSFLEVRDKDGNDYYCDRNFLTFLPDCKDWPVEDSGAVKFHVWDNDSVKKAISYELIGNHHLAIFRKDSTSTTVPDKVFYGGGSKFSLYGGSVYDDHVLVVDAKGVICRCSSSYLREYGETASLDQLQDLIYRLNGELNEMNLAGDNRLCFSFESYGDGFVINFCESVICGSDDDLVTIEDYGMFLSRFLVDMSERLGHLSLADRFRYDYYGESEMTFSYKQIMGELLAMMYVLWEDTDVSSLNGIDNLNGIRGDIENILTKVCVFYEAFGDGNADVLTLDGYVGLRNMLSTCLLSMFQLYWSDIGGGDKDGGSMSNLIDSMVCHRLIPRLLVVNGGTRGMRLLDFYINA